MNKVELLQEIFNELVSAPEELYKAMKEEIASVDRSSAYLEIVHYVFETVDKVRKEVK